MHGPDGRRLHLLPDTGALTRPDPVKPESADTDENGEISAKGESKGRQRKKRNRRNNDRRRRKRPSDEAKASEGDGSDQNENAPSEEAATETDTGEQAPSIPENNAAEQPEMDLKPLQDKDAVPPVPQEVPPAS